MSKRPEDVKDGELVKVCVLGASKSGKTELLAQLVKDRPFSETYRATTGVDYVLTKKSNDRFGYWDIPGSELMSRILPVYFKDARLFVVAFDLSNKKALSNAKTCIKKIVMSHPNARILLTGTKSDLKIAEENNEMAIQALMKKAKIHPEAYAQVSAKERLGLETFEKKIAYFGQPYTHEAESEKMQKLEKTLGKLWNYADIKGSLVALLKDYGALQKVVTPALLHSFAPPPKPTEYREHGLISDTIAKKIAKLKKPNETTLAERLKTLTDIERTPGSRFDDLMSFIHEKLKGHWSATSLAIFDPPEKDAREQPDGRNTIN